MNNGKIKIATTIYYIYSTSTMRLCVLYGASSRLVIVGMLKFVIWTGGASVSERGSFCYRMFIISEYFNLSHQNR